VARIASEFGVLDEEDFVDQEGDVEGVDTMVLLLTEGLPDDAE
jgi:hypothetical protein